MQGQYLMVLIGVLLMLTLAPGIASAATPNQGVVLKGPVSHRAKLLSDGHAVAPPTAPPKVRRVIQFANQIRDTPYVWGGGHASFRSSGYDCSGSVSLALRGGQFIRKPLISGQLTQWGKAGRGNWITVYTNATHAFMVVAGLRFDTRDGPGPRWHKSPGSRAGFVKRHPATY